MADQKRKILVVDDDTDVLETIDDILTAEGFSTTFSYDGHDALQKIAEQEPDLILLDCYLPQMMGIEVLKEIRKVSEDIPVIMMTGHGEEQLVVSLMKAGASDYLKKPLGKFTLLSAVKDVLRKKDISREIIQSERLLLLGELFPFVAHEIRNPLHAIGGALTIIQKRTKQKDPLIEQSINVINEEITRLTNFVKECLDFSNPSDPSKFVPTDINDIITSSLDLMIPALQETSKKIKVSLSLQENLPKISTNFNEIKQVVLNIIKNSVEAIEGEGRLEIKTSFPQEYGNTITIEFNDNGKGIKKEIAKKIFDPFFTTKTGSGGMGLGLSVCRKIICENHHGTLTIDSVENEGTSVVIRLPLNHHSKK